MSTFNSLSKTADTPTLPVFELAETLSGHEREVIQSLLVQAPLCLAQASDDKAKCTQGIPIVAVVDGRGLACPLPLLKTKVALREVNIGEALYVIATDPNSRADIAAFCQQQANRHQTPASTPALRLLLQYQSQANADSNDSKSTSRSAVTDTLFHFIITKMDSN